MFTESAFVSAIKEKVRDALKLAQPDIEDYLRKKINAIFEEAVSGFYSDYDPEYYERNESLYKLLDIQTSPSGLFKYDFDASRMTQFRHPSGDAESGLYQTVFRSGWHGGAEKMGFGAMFWRAPYGIYSRWGRRATRALPTTPLNRFNMLLEDSKPGMINDITEIRTIYIQKVLNGR